jgi:hypothetical protein
LLTNPVFIIFGIVADQAGFHHFEIINLHNSF